MTRSSSLARRIIVAEAASATAGAGPRARSVSMVARLPCIARGCVVTTAMKLRCQPGRRHRPRTGLAAALDRRRHDGGSKRLPSIESYKHLPVLRAALAAHQSKYVTQRVEHDADAA